MENRHGSRKKIPLLFQCPSDRIVDNTFGTQETPPSDRNSERFSPGLQKSCPETSISSQTHLLSQSDELVNEVEGDGGKNDLEIRNSSLLPHSQQSPTIKAAETGFSLFRPDPSPLKDNTTFQLSQSKSFLPSSPSLREQLHILSSQAGFTPRSQKPDRFLMPSGQNGDHSTSWISPTGEHVTDISTSSSRKRYSMLRGRKILKRRKLIRDLTERVSPPLEQPNNVEEGNVDNVFDGKNFVYDDEDDCDHSEFRENQRETMEESENEFESDNAESEGDDSFVSERLHRVYSKKYRSQSGLLPESRSRSRFIADFAR